MEKGLKKCFGMAKLKEKPLSIEKVMDEVINKILAVDTSKEEIFRIPWNNGVSVHDSYEEQPEINVGNKKEGYFVIPAVIQKES